MTEADTCMRCIVSGRVQGVWFRASTQRRAVALGLRGHAGNLPDGRVEVVACGAVAQVRTLQAWLWEGPPAAQVTDVQCEEIPAADCRGFVAR